MKIGFDNEKYLDEQSQYIEERVNNYDKLYLEFGGKLFADLHAKRVLPGFDENVKVKLLTKLKDKVEVIVCVFAGDIERNKIRGDFGITYDMEIFRLIDDLREKELQVNSVVITRYEERPAISLFINRLEIRGIKVYKHYSTVGYPNDIDAIVSDDGYGKNEYIETTKPIVVVTAPGPNSGKLATCLNQLYHEFKRGNSAGYSKFETFPVWNIPLKHPLNIAYEAATVDLADVNMIDPFHLETYGETAVNYNRDIEAFPLLRRIIEKITNNESIYKSPTDMGVNRVKFGIIDDDIIKEASEQEIIRRYFKTSCDYKEGNLNLETFRRAELIMRSSGLEECDRKVVEKAREKAETIREKLNKDVNEVVSVVSLELNDGTIVTGKRSELMDAPSAAILNAIKYLSKFDDELLLLSPKILEPILKLKKENLKDKNVPLDSEEILIALSISAATNPTAELALSKLTELDGAQAHCTHIIRKSDEQFLRKLGIEITCEPVFLTENLYYSR